MKKLLLLLLFCHSSYAQQATAVASATVIESNKSYIVQDFKQLGIQLLVQHNTTCAQYSIQENNNAQILPGCYHSVRSKVVGNSIIISLANNHSFKTYVYHNGALQNK